MRIFGREPSLWIAAIGAVLGVGVGFGLDSLSAGQAAWIVAVLNAALGVFNAIKVRPISPVAFTYLGTALFSLLAAYGLDFSQEAIGAVNFAVLAVVGLLVRGQVSPDDATTGGVNSREWN